jgi:chorismate synthase
MIELIDETRKKGDTLGGIFEVARAGSCPVWARTRRGI